MTEAQVKDILKRIVPTIDWADLDADADLAKAGLDSLDKASVIMEIETEAGIRVDDSRYDEILTISDLIQVTA